LIVARSGLRIEKEEHGFIELEEDVALAFPLVRLELEKFCVERRSLIEVRRVKRGFQNAVKFHSDGKVALGDHFGELNDVDV
jgi:hypothetical protein